MRVMSYKIEVKNLYKIFGSKPQHGLKLLNSGLSKDEIFEKTGMTIGAKDINLGIKEGEIFVVMGLSGSGKSTLVRLLNRLIESTSGQIFIDNEDINHVSNTRLNIIRRNKISMVFQSFALLPHLNVLENTGFGLELSGEPPKVREEKALAALAQVGLENNANSYPDELSGGMQQRVGLARALANDPDILLMDEAFSALDPLIRTEMQDELLRLQAKHQRTVVFISHDLDEAMRIGDRIAIMQNGEVIQVGTPDEILNAPENDYVKSFFKGVDVGNVYSAGDIARKQQITLIKKQSSDGLRAGLKALRDYDRYHAYVIDTNLCLVGVVSADTLHDVIRDHKTLEEALIDVPPILSNTPIKDIMTIVAQAPCPVPVVDENNIYKGVVSQANLLTALDGEGITNE